MDDLIEGDGFERARGLEFLSETIEEDLELLAFVVTDDEMGGGEAVFAGVLGAAGFALGGAGTGGEPSSFGTPIRRNAVSR